MHRYPESTQVTTEIVGAAQIINNLIRDKSITCYAIWNLLSEEAKKAAEANTPNWSVIKALWIIADICSMTLDGSNINEPFKAFAVFADRRSAVPEDFDHPDIEFISQVLTHVEHPGLRARLADFIWIVDRPRKIDNALIAIDAYMEQSAHIDQNRIDEWNRAVTLCRQLGKGGHDRLDKIKQELEIIAKNCLQNDEGNGLLVARLLFERKLFDLNNSDFAEILAQRGELILKNKGEFWNGRAYLDLAEKWFNRIAKSDRAADMTLQIALSFEAEADQRISLDHQNGHLVAQSFIEDAIKTLRMIPKKFRDSRSVDSQINRLSKRLSDVGMEVVDALKTVSTGETDISEIIQQSVNAVSGKTMLSALINFARLHSGAKLDAMTDFANQMLQAHIFSSLVSSTHISRDGRVVAKTPSAGLNETNDNREKAVFGKIMQHYSIDMNIVCQGIIIPAWRALIQEHTVKKSDLAHIVSLSPIVPPGRAELFAKGLSEGFEGDFTSAIYILAPQIEHLVRWQLKQIGAKTTNLDIEGIENENGLSTLIDVPELNNVFDKNTIFEIRALFCSALGPNLRNEVAHGLLDAENGDQIGTIYAWWWVLRLTLISFVKYHSSQISKVEQRAAIDTSTATLDA